MDGLASPCVQVHLWRQGSLMPGGNVTRWIGTCRDGSGLVAKSCLILCDLMDCRLPGSSVHGILQAEIPEWVALPFSRWSSQPRDWTWVSCIVRQILYQSHQESQEVGAVYCYYFSSLSCSGFYIWPGDGSVYLASLRIFGLFFYRRYKKEESQWEFVSFHRSYFSSPLGLRDKLSYV